MIAEPIRRGRGHRRVSGFMSRGGRGTGAARGRDDRPAWPNSKSVVDQLGRSSRPKDLASEEEKSARKHLALGDDAVQFDQGIGK